MELKYLSLIMAGIIATTGLTACGDDDDDFDDVVVVQPDDGETDGGEAGGGETDGGETGGGETGGGETGGDDTVTGDAEDNVGSAATDPNAGTPTVGGQLYVRGNASNFDRELNPATANGTNATVLNSKSIQNKKLDNIVLGRETIRRQDNVRQSFLRYSGEAVNGFSDKTEDQTRKLQSYNRDDNGVDVTSDDWQENGLIYAQKDDGVTDVWGQEDLTGQGFAQNVDGSTLSTRFYGNKYVDINNATSLNSHKFVGVERANGSVAIGSLQAPDFQEMKLRNVQYGRVTSDIDKLDEDMLKKGINYYEANIQNKSPTNADDGVDTYFYRGLGETTIAQMDALKQEGGKYKYQGHALMYGIDNSYHGDTGSPDTNSFGGADLAIEGKGNYVDAVVDMAAGTVDGTVYNVWRLGKDNGSNYFKKDELVSFDGDIFGNTTKGTADRTYVAGDDNAAFKGSFFGNQAEELGGSFNSVTSGYGSSKWGGVFGAERGAGNANQTE